MARWHVSKSIKIRMTLWVPFIVLHTSREYLSSLGDPVVLNRPALLKFRSIAGDTLLTSWPKHYMLTSHFFSIIYSFIFHALHCYILNRTAAYYSFLSSHTGRMTACSASNLALNPDYNFGTHVCSAFGHHRISLPNINYSFIRFFLILHKCICIFIYLCSFDPSEGLLPAGYRTCQHQYTEYKQYKVSSGPKLTEIYSYHIQFSIQSL